MDATGPIPRAKTSKPLDHLEFYAEFWPYVFGNFQHGDGCARTCSKLLRSSPSGAEDKRKLRWAQMYTTQEGRWQSPLVLPLRSSQAHIVAAGAGRFLICSKLADHLLSVIRPAQGGEIHYRNVRREDTIRCARSFSS